MEPHEKLARVQAALSGLTGELPRRAVVLEDGSVRDKTACPALPEVTAVSLACEILRAGSTPVYSRHTPTLLGQCLDGNDPGAWRALLDDTTTGDMDVAAAAAFWSDAANLHGVVQCLVNASTGMHMWVIVCVVRHMLRTLGRAAEVDLGRIFHRMCPDIVRAILRRTADINADCRATIAQTLGGLMMWCDIPVPDLVAMVQTVVDTAHDDTMRLFLHAPLAALVEHTPSLAEKVLKRAERATLAQCYPSCTLLAAMTEEQLRPFRDRVMQLVTKTMKKAMLQKAIDRDLSCVCGVLTKKASSDPLQCLLAHALCCTIFDCTGV